MPIRPIALALPLLLAASSCSALTLGVRHEEGLEQVEELLGHVERLQATAVETKERTGAAVERLRALVTPEFKGDPVISHGEFVDAVKLCQQQAKELRKQVRPLRNTGEELFADWAGKLRSFGNVAMRQRSQERLEEAQKRFDAIVSTAGLAQIGLDTFSGDLSDQALFLEHDFNPSSVALVAQEMDGLKSRARELSKRLDACVAACRAYVEFASPGPNATPVGREPNPEPGTPKKTQRTAPGAQG